MSDTKPVSFVFRADLHLADLIEAAVHLSGDTVSEWLRTRTEYAANRELTEHRTKLETAAARLKNPAHALGMTLGGTAADGCVHPRHAVEQVGLVVRCRACGNPLRVLL